MDKTKSPPSLVDCRLRDVIGGLPAARFTLLSTGQWLVTGELTSTFTQSGSNVLVARQQWPRDVIRGLPDATRRRFEIGRVRPKSARATN